MTYTRIYSHKLWYIVLGTEFVFLFRIHRALGGVNRLYLRMTTDIYCIFSVKFYNKRAAMIFFRCTGMAQPRRVCI